MRIRDIIHYGASNIYFFIYDKENLIDNPQVFKNNYGKQSEEKNIFIVIHQPKIFMRKEHQMENENLPASSCFTAGRQICVLEKFFSKIVNRNR